MVSHILILLSILFLLNVYYFYVYYLPKTIKKYNTEIKNKSKIEYFQSYELNL